MMFGVVSHFFHYLQKTLCGIVGQFLPQAHLSHQVSLLPLLLSLRCKETPVYHTTSSTRSFACQRGKKFCPQRRPAKIFPSSVVLPHTYFNNNVRINHFYFRYHSYHCRKICLVFSNLISIVYFS